MASMAGEPPWVGSPKPGTQKAKCCLSTSTEALDYITACPFPNALAPRHLLLGSWHCHLQQGRKHGRGEHVRHSGGLAWAAQLFGRPWACKGTVLLQGSPDTTKDYQLNKTRSDWGHYALLD